jgi:hypothetical protein
MVNKVGRSKSSATNTLDECACVNRDYDVENYGIIKIVAERNQTGTNPGCSYIPCSRERSGAMLLDPEVLDLKDKCKVVQCNAYTTLIDVRDSNITTAEQHITCDGKMGDPPQDTLSQSGGIPTAQQGDTTTVTVGGPSAPGVIPSETIDVMWTWAFYIGIALVVIFLLWLVKKLLTPDAAPVAVESTSK